MFSTCGATMARNVDSLEGLFPRNSLACLFKHFADCSKAKSKGLPCSCDGIHPMDAYKACGEQLIRLKSIAVPSVLDYCPDLCLILVCRLRPEGDAIRPITELHSLDVPDTRTYLTFTIQMQLPNLREADVIEKLHERSEGLPMHLDRMLKSLKVSSLASVLEAEMQGVSAGDTMLKATSKAARFMPFRALPQSQDKGSQRSFSPSRKVIIRIAVWRNARNRLNPSLLCQRSRSFPKTLFS